jgi:hypothetical protein
MTVTETALEPRPPQALAAQLRAEIGQFEALLAQQPEAVFGDSDLMPLTHTFVDGMYVREILIPAGTLLTGKIHRHAHPNVLLRGEVLVVTEQGGREHLVAPRLLMSPAGTKRAIYALTDTVWITIHANPDNLRDLAALEALIIAPDYAALAGPPHPPHEGDPS